MVALKSPLIGMELGPQEALYVAALERQIAALSINEVKYRALLEMITGEAWDDLKTDMEEGEIKKIAIKAVEKKFGLKYGEAKRKVEENIAGTNAVVLEG